MAEACGWQVHLRATIVCFSVFSFLFSVESFQASRGLCAWRRFGSTLHVSKSAGSSPSDVDTVTLGGEVDDILSSDISSIELLSSAPTSFSSSLGPGSGTGTGTGTGGSTILVADGTPEGVGVSVDDLDAANFGTIFRHCAPYIAQHRSSIVVIHIPGHVLQNRNLFESISDDISIMHLLGVQVVLVVGVRDQLDAKLVQAGSQPVYYNSMRITDEETLRFLKETSGAARFEIESSLTRGFRGRSPGQQGINVVSGNFFYTAKPLGVRDGVDFKFTGEVRRIESDNIKKRLESGDVVLLTSLGYSPSGESFNVPSESLAAECAANLKAAKIIFLTEGEMLWDKRKERKVQSLRLAQAIALLDQWGIHSNTYNQVDADTSEGGYSVNCIDTPVVEQSPFAMESAGMVDKSASGVWSGGSVIRQSRDESQKKAGLGQQSMAVAAAVTEQIRSQGCEDSKVANFKRLVARCVYALNGGVKRAHLILPSQGTLLKELYTRDGEGMLISRDVYEGIRQAQASDVRAVQDLISPLVQEGILVHRSRDQLEKDMPNCYVLMRDGEMLACAMLKRYGDSHGEVSCLAVHPGYRREGRGETILAYLERRALVMGIKQLFVLSTRTMLWFEERGFVPSDPSLLPPTRAYNSSRGSKVYIKMLGSQRDVDAEELLWNIGPF